MGKELVSDITVPNLESISLRFPSSDFALLHNEIMNKHQKELSIWMPWVNNMLSLEANRHFINNAMLMNQVKKACVAFIFEKEELIGSIALNKMDTKTGIAQMGFWLIEAKRGRGIMSHCCKTFLNFIFTSHPISTIQMKIQAKNTKSVKIAQKLGFQAQKKLIDGFTTENQHFSLLTFELIRCNWGSQTLFKTNIS